MLARLVPGAGITEDFLTSCGPEFLMCDAHLPLLASLFYLVIPYVSKLGERHSHTYVPHEEQLGRQLGFVGLQHDGPVHYDGAVMKPKAPLPPIRTSCWGNEANGILRAPFHRQVIHNKMRWFETWAVDGAQGCRACRCWLGSENVGVPSQPAFAPGEKGSKAAPIHVPGSTSSSSHDSNDQHLIHPLNLGGNEEAAVPPFSNRGAAKSGNGGLLKAR